MGDKSENNLNELKSLSDYLASTISETRLALDSIDSIPNTVNRNAAADIMTTYINGQIQIKDNVDLMIRQLEASK